VHRYQNRSAKDFCPRNIISAVTRHS